MKLQPLLSEYIMEYGHLPLPGAGSLYMHSVPAVLNSEEEVVAPPVSTFIFKEKEDDATETDALTNFIKQRLNISAAQVRKLLFTEANLPLALKNDGSCNWPAIGRFQKQANGAITFIQLDALQNYLTALPLEAIHRQTKTEFGAENPLAEEPVDELPKYVRKDYWQIFAIIIFLLSVLLILVRYYSA